ncbi:MAG: hypothetical protein IT463_10800 [Planctomycetes bacterium]|nr:hypothetical protein [Planctomycetota bacterium]
MLTGTASAAPQCLWLPVLNLLALPCGVAGVTFLMLAAEQQGDHSAAV